MVTVSESLATPPDVKEKIHLLYQKSKFVEKSMQNFSETLRSEMETFDGVAVAKCGGHQPSMPRTQGSMPSAYLKWDAGNTQDYDIVLNPEVEGGGAGSQDDLQPQQAQGTPELQETNKRKARSFLKWKPLFFQK